MALMHHSIRSGSPADVIDILVPVGRQRLSTGFARLHRTVRMPARASSLGSVPLAPVPRAVADTVRQLSVLRDVRAVVADAVQLGRCTVGQLAEELRTGPVKGSAMFRSVLQIRREPAEVAQMIKGALERGLRRPALPIRTIPCGTSATFIRSGLAQEGTIWAKCRV
jgi:hypothetical protein